MNILLPLLTSFSVLALAVFFDERYALVRTRTTDLSPVGARIWGLAALVVAFVAVVLASSWLVAARSKPPRWVSFCLAVLGLLIVFSVPVAFAGIPYITPLFARLISALPSSAASPGTFLSIAASAVLLSAICAFLKPPRTHAA